MKLTLKYLTLPPPTTHCTTHTHTQSQGERERHHWTLPTQAKINSPPLSLSIAALNLTPLSLHGPRRGYSGDPPLDLNSRCCSPRDGNGAGRGGAGGWYPRPRPDPRRGIFLTPNPAPNGDRGSPSRIRTLKFQPPTLNEPQNPKSTTNPKQKI